MEPSHALTPCLHVFPLSHAQPIVHWGFIPTVILVGMLFTKPRPSIGQLLFVG